MYSWVQLSHLVQWSGGSLKSPTSRDFTVSDISTDTRHLKKGDVFLALRGQNFDGHRFLQAAAEKGASLLISEENVETETPLLIVEDTLKAFARISKHLRSQFTKPVVAVTGSAGKSSTKDAIATLLGENVLKSPASFNNLLGVSKTLCLIQDTTAYAVLEMGMNASGEIAEMCEYFNPLAGLITNIGDAHIGKLGGQMGIYAAKKELFDYLASRPGKSLGVAVNVDDPLVERAFRESGASALKSLTYSTEGKEAAVRILEKKIDPHSGYLKLKLSAGAMPWSEELPVFGLHHAQNIAAGFAMGMLLGIETSTLRERVKKVLPASHRGEIHLLAEKITLIDESYNSNPTALTSSLNSLSKLASPRRRLLVIGEMRELGEFSDSLHRKVGEAFADLNASSSFELVGVGSQMRFFIEAVTARLPKSQCRLVENVTEAIDYVTKAVRPGDLCLVKGSRGVQLDKLVEHLRQN